MTIFSATERLRERVHNADDATGQHGEWPEPKPLPEGLPPVEPFISGLLPPALRPWVMDIAERMQCPPDFTAAAHRVIAGDLGDKFAPRDVYRRCWSGLSSREAARSAVAVLCDHDWLTEVPQVSAGRTATVYLVNPKLSAGKS